VNLQSSFSKMSKGLFPPSPEERNNRFSTISLEDWNQWVIKQRQVYLARKNASIRIAESESSSQGWPTPQVTDATRGNQIRKPEELTDAAKKGGCRNLREDVVNWPTPSVSDTEGAPKPLDDKGRRVSQTTGTILGAKLQDTVKWATPSTMETITQEGLHSFNGKYYMKPTKKTSMQTLFGIEDVSKNQKHQTDLGLQVGAYSQADQQNPNNLGKPQEPSVTRKLSPLWVAQLMGLPMATWCVINASIHCAPLEME